MIINLHVNDATCILFHALVLYSMQSPVIPIDFIAAFIENGQALSAFAVNFISNLLIVNTGHDLTLTYYSIYVLGRIFLDHVTRV